MSNPIPEGSVVITPTEIYAKVNTLTELVTQVLARDEAAALRQADLKEAALRRDADAARRESDQKAEVEAIKLRLGAVERKVYIASGFAAAVGGVLGGYLPSVIGS
jgi:hypothetical protein